MPRNELPTNDTITTHDPAMSKDQHPNDAEHDVEPSSQDRLAPKPSLRLLFSLLSRRHLFLIILPAILSSIVAGGIAPFMTFVVGQAFDAFSRFAIVPDRPQVAIDALLHDVGLVALQLIGLAVGSVALGSVTSSLWIWAGEVNTMGLRKRVYDAVSRKEMEWFDSHMGLSNDEDPNSSTVGAGGLLAKFTRGTEQVRSASSLASGLLIQHLTTVIACLVLALTRSYQLTLVILSSVPLLMFIQGLAQGMASPLMAHERQKTAETATLIERCVALVSTVKAFNAERFETSRSNALFQSLRIAARRLNTVWAFTSGMAQFVMMAMFVQAFWFGAKLVRQEKATAGDVMSVFWACLIATSNLQMCVPQLIILAQGKEAIADLLEVVMDDPKHKPLPPTPTPPPKLSHRFRGSLDKDSHPPSAFSQRDKSISMPSPLLKPKHLHVPIPLSTPTTSASSTTASMPPSISLHNITLAYPTRPTVSSLSHVSMHLSGGKTTFIVGASGSGKSTIAALLLGWYFPQKGELKVGGVEVDMKKQSKEYRDWVEREVCCVGQGAAGCVILEGKSVLENVAAAGAFVPRAPLEGGDHEYPPGLPNTAKFKPISRKQVKEACQACLMHEFVRDFPDGYETKLSSGMGGEEGISLSGGQKQRLTLARAWIRDPPILILDEATSALDPTSRLLILEALKMCRRGKTTIVITHDLGQIEASDFVYVLKDGRVVERGYRRDLESAVGPGKRSNDVRHSGKGEFRRMLDAQQDMGGWLPEKEIQELITKGSLEDIVAEAEDAADDAAVPRNLKHQSLAIRPLAWGNVLGGKSRSFASFVSGSNRRRSGSLTPKASFSRLTSDRYTSGPKRRHNRPLTADFSPSPSRGTVPLPLESSPFQLQSSSSSPRRFSMPFSPKNSSMVVNFKPKPKWLEDEETFQQEKEMMKRTGASAQGGREKRAGVERIRHSEDVRDPNLTNGIPTPSIQSSPNRTPRSLFPILHVVFPSIPYKPLLFAGLLVCILSGAVTPVFSFLLARLLFEVSSGARDTKIINLFGGIVLATAALDGLFLGLKYWIMETSAMYWVTRMRLLSMTRVLMQDRAWFDEPTHSPARMIQLLIKDADDARDLLSVVLAQLVVVVVMLGTGLIWAMIVGWQLTLAGIAIAPVFGIVMVLQARLVGRCEEKGRKAREQVAKGYYDVIINIRSIRSMYLQPFFDIQFDAAAEKALIVGVQGALVEGCTYGVASGLIYLAEAVLFYVGAVLLAKGTYSYIQMLQVLNLVVFSVTIGSQLMAFTEKIAKSVQATADFNDLMTLSTDVQESRGSLRPLLPNSSISFEHVKFAYPEKIDVPVLRDVSFSIPSGTCVAIVGSSGCGKSTIAALLQRLYEPLDGTITLGTYPLSSFDVHFLRDHVAIVSQQPHLFDASIKDNIRYGNANITDLDIRKAAESANIHDFISNLPQGYDTYVGENAVLVSGGQAQRIQIARAFARRAKVIILDESTSALDVSNEAAVIDAVSRVKDTEGTTIVMITHKVPLMKMCDSIVVMDGGRVVEQGAYDELIQDEDGVFARLAGAGEWTW